MKKFIISYFQASAAGTFYYIDPEYQQIGMLGVKSNVYSLGVMLLQIITTKQPMMRLAHHVSFSIEKGTSADILDPNVKDWPVEEAMKFVKIALKCTELRRKDRPDLGTIVLPELSTLRALGEENVSSCLSSPLHSQVSEHYYSSNPSLSNSEDESSSRNSIA